MESVGRRLFNPSQEAEGERARDQTASKIPSQWPASSGKALDLIASRNTQDNNRVWGPSGQYMCLWWHFIFKLEQYFSHIFAVEPWAIKSAA